METNRKLAVALSAVVLLQGCAIYGKELRSIPTVGPDAVIVHACPGRQGISYWPSSGGRLCLSTHAIEVEVEAENGQTTFFAIGPLLPLVPFFPKEGTDSAPLRIQLGFHAGDGYTFAPWQMSVTTRGEILKVSRALANVREGKGVHTVELDPRDQSARPLDTWFVLIFARHVAPDEEFFLSLHVTAPDGSDVQLPSIRFSKGRLSYLAAVP